jgi:hypothetical protein
VQFKNYAEEYMLRAEKIKKMLDWSIHRLQVLEDGVSSTVPKVTNFQRFS